MWIEVDYATFMDALMIADERGDRVRVGTPAAERLFAEHGLAGLVAPPPEVGPRPKMGILARGLFAGIYIYSLSDNLWNDRVFRWYVGPPARPLRRYAAREMHDVAVSYAKEDRATLALPLAEALRAAGLSVFLIDVEEDPSDPLWRIRYRTGLYRSRHFVPIVTHAFLKREGTRVEMFDMTRLNAEHQSTELFSPVLPWIAPGVDAAALADEWGASSVRGSTDHGYRWVLEHLFAMPPDWPEATRTAFLASLAGASRALVRDEPVPDVRFLELLTPLVTGCRLLTDLQLPEGLPPGKPLPDVVVASVVLRHPWWGARGHQFGLTIAREGRADPVRARASLRARYVGVVGDDVDHVAEYGPPERWTEFLRYFG